MDRPSFSPLAPGEIFARDFRIVRPLSQGGMGAVYVVVQVSTGRERALKLMHPKLVQDERQRRRFEQEARVGGSIDSAHVVEVVAAGVDDETGSPWLCMELLRGQDLAAVGAKRGALPPGEVLAIFGQLCHAVGAAHDVGVVHRDLKPENVFLATSRQAGVPFVVKVLDFGIAKLVADGQKTDTAPIGTPLWMAPEQTMTGGPIGPPTDVWALGLIAFRLLAGCAYWRGASDESASAITLLREIAIEPLEAASERAARLGGEPLPEGFDGWFARCVVREVDQRFADAHRALEALTPLLGGELVLPAASPSGPGAPLARDGAGSSSLGGVSNTQDPSRPSAPASETPARISGLEATEPLAPPQADAKAEVVRAAAVQGGARRAGDDSPPSSALVPAGVAAPRRFGLAAGVIAVVVVGGLVLRELSRSADERDAIRAAEEKEKQREEAARTLEADKIKLAERRAELDTQLGKMARVPATSVAIGSDEHDNDEKPVTRVDVAAFEIDTHEVTGRAYGRCFGAGKCAPAGTGERCNGGKREGDPINCVDHVQASAFCAFVGKRLPTEEEWELAARGAEGRLYPWGPGAPADEACWKRDAGTCASGAHPSQSPFGLVDVAGNVREWTASPYCPYSRRGCEASSKVARGGAWSDTDPLALRGSARTKLPPDARLPDVGFRCARDALY